MLSTRGQKSAASQDIRWRFAPGGNNRYDKVTNPRGVVPFGTAENCLMHKELKEFVAQNVKIPSVAFTYRFSTAGGPRFSIALAAHVNEYFHPFSPIKAEDTITASGLTAIHAMLGYSLGDPGDAILVARPIYGRFELDFGNTAGLEIVYADVAGADPFEEEAVGAYEHALAEASSRGVNVKAVLIVNPNNPLGRCYPSATLRQIMSFCQKHDLHLISDEVYALSVYPTSEPDPTPFTSVLTLDSSSLIDQDKLHVLYGMSKDFAAAGLRLGTLISRNKLLLKSLAANIRFHNPSGMSVAIGTAILEDRTFVKSFLEMSRARLAGAREYAVDCLQAAGVKIASGGNAGFFLYIDLSPWLPHGLEGKEREYALAQRLLDGGVGLHPCEEHNEKPGWFRLVFSLERELLFEGLKR
ncbi:putative aspartate aminotransferase [Hyaloscypha variabilis F]|uniref:Putative aspartate aminotransferase n=1 Tax=Hyaloscypha variabilis (strain UAMH 11265 / GT02V1 / F) TaxID=1149755 RepID=A0A2J6RQT2_HYAVF|nr:putative aspartate aminotransferase [Hyaloscypha variabilis F]